MTKMMRGKHVDDLFEGYVLLEKAMKLPKSLRNLNFEDKIQSKKTVNEVYLAFKKIYDEDHAMVKTRVFQETVPGMLQMLTYHKSHSERLQNLVMDIQEMELRSDDSEDLQRLIKYSSDSKN